MKSSGLILAWALTVCLSGGLAASARAQDDSDRIDDAYWSAALLLGLAGDVDFHLDDLQLLGLNLGSGGSSFDEDAKASVGGALSYVAPLHRYFALGGRFSLLSWRSDSDADTKRNLAFDLAVMPQLRAPVRRRYEVYLGLPIGFSINLLREVESSGGAFGINGSTDADVGTGLNLSVLAGFRMHIARGIGLLAELGYVFHKVWHELDARVDTPLGGGQVSSSDLDVRLNQLGLNLGVFF